jgi:signal transduction histidine kinase/serine phosphatase RsbU (regulator of sigma subunit)
VSADGTAVENADIRFLFLSSGQLGKDLLAVDWEATPLGPLADWPQSLKTIVQVVITSRFSMWMAWGPELSFFANESYRRATLGAKYPWALGKPASEVWAEIWPEIGPRIEAVMKTGVASWDESLLLILERNGFAEETYHTFSYSPLTDDGGKIVGMLCVVSEDTKRVIGDQRMTILRDLASALSSARSEEDVFANASVALSANLGPLPFSLAYLFDDRGTGARLALSAGATASDPIAPPTIDAGDGSWPVREALRGRSVIIDDLQERFQAVPSREGFNPPEKAIVMPLRSQTGELPYGFLVAGISAYQMFDSEYEGFVVLVANQLAAAIANARAHEAERQRAERLAELDDAKTRFFTNVSHEFRTPLTLLLGPASDSLSDQADPLTPLQRERTELVQRNGERLLRLVNSLLDFSRIESGRSDAQFEPIDLALYTAQLASMFRAATERAGIDLAVECSPLGEEVFVDREMWAKIVSNLLSNALKFTFEGRITVRLAEVEVDQLPWIELSVTDTGVGVAPAEQAHLFERFHRVAGVRSRTYEGSGIGLALVAELVALHGGTVTATSSPGAGSTFKVLVPFGSEHLATGVVLDRSSDVARSPEILVGGLVDEAMRWLDGSTVPIGALSGVDRAGAVERPLVLMADDNADMRQYVAGLLVDLCEVVTASDGLEALEFARSRTPDLVLTDVMMPNLDGFGLLAALRKDPVTTRVPIIMLSARAGEEAAVEGLSAGADDYLVKPFSALELVARVRSNLELDRARREVSERERQIAQELQRSLMPSEHFDAGELEIATFYQAGVQGTQVGGDWYDVIELGAGRTALVIGDVMGRGVRAAAVMGQARSAIRAFSQMDLPPATMLEFLDKTVGDFTDGQIVTCIYGVYDSSDHSFTFGSAGHLPPFVKAPGIPTRRLEGGLSGPLGSNPITFNQARVILPEDALLVMYTDGLVERRSESLDDRINEAAALIDDTSASGQDLVTTLVDRLCPNGSEDDVAILAAQLLGHPDRFSVATFAVPADEGAVSMARTRIRESLESGAIPASVIDDVVLIGSELVTNAIVHGHPPIEMRIRQTASEVTLEVFDTATFFPRRTHPSPLEEHGRGLGIVDVLARDWGTRMTDGGKAVWCSVAIPPAST